MTRLILTQGAGRRLWAALGAGLLLAAPAALPSPAAAQSAARALPFVSDRLSVEVVGFGPDLILIPGLASSREVWRAEANRLKGSRRVHMVQLAGFAGEPWEHGDGPFMEPMVEALAAYIREAGLERPAVIGHSLGGTTALMLTQRHPDLVDRAMSVDSLPFYSAMFGPQITSETARPFADRAAAMMLAADEETFRQGQAQTATSLSRNPQTQGSIVEWSASSDRRAMATAVRELMTLDLRPLLPSITRPVWAVYAADANGGAPAAQAQTLWSREYSGLPGVRLVKVEDARHFIMSDQPAEFAELVDQFLAD